MSKALDKLDETVKSEVRKGSAIKNMTRDQLVDEITSITSSLRANLSFFQGLGAELSKKLHGNYLTDRKLSNKSASVSYLDEVNKHLTGKAKLLSDNSYSGAICDTMIDLLTLLDGIIDKCGDLFTDKAFNLYNTKMSHVAVLGMMNSARKVSDFAEAYIDQVMYDNSKGALPKPAAYRTKMLKGSVGEVASIINNVVNGRKSKSFVAAVSKYKASGNDVNVLGGDDVSSVQFAKLEGDIDELCVDEGRKGLAIFRWIGNWWVDLQDAKARKRVALREQHLARVQFLQMELAGEDPESERYQRLVKIIKNYEQMIDRLNQQIDKYYNEQ